MIARHSTDQRAAWLAELRATLALGWPLVLANVAQNALITSDVILMGWMGSEALAAGALGTNLYFAFLIFGIGLVNATSPMIAEELGRKRHSVREVRRTVRQGLWASVTVAIPIWIVTWNGEKILLAIGQEPGLAHNAGEYMRALQWSLLPFLLFLVLRSFLAALERPGWALFIGLLAIPVNFAAAYALMFGSFGLPALGLVGAGLGTVISSTFMFAGARLRDRPRPEAQALSYLRTLLAGRLAALSHPVAHRRAHRPDAGLRGDDLQRRRHADGPHRRERAGGPCDRPADRLLLLLRSPRHRAGRDGARGARLWRAGSGRGHPRRLDRLCARRRLHGR